MSISQPRNITVIPASTKTGHATVEALLADPRKPKVTGYYRDLSRVPEALSANPNFVAVKGDIDHGSTLSFQGADAVLAITPPRVKGHDDLVEFAKKTSENIKEAVLNSKSVKRLAYLSSIGAQCDKDVVSSSGLPFHDYDLIISNPPPFPQPTKFSQLLSRDGGTHSLPETPTHQKRDGTPLSLECPPLPPLTWAQSSRITMNSITHMHSVQ